MNIHSFGGLKVKLKVNEILLPMQGGTVAGMNFIKHKYHP